MTFDDIRQASFREVVFYVEDADVSGGRRTVKHEFPQRDIPYTEDLGKKSKTFNVTGYVTGKNYQYQRDLLIEALDKEGSGVLIHPLHGEITVQVDTYSYKSTWSDHGKTTFSISFAETQDTELVLVTEPPETAIDKLCDEIENISGNVFGSDFLADVSTLYANAVGFVGAVISAISSVMSFSASVLDFADDITRSMLDAQAGYAGLIQTPDKLRNRINAPYKRLQEANRLNRKSNNQITSLKFGSNNNKFTNQIAVKIFDVINKASFDIHNATKITYGLDTPRLIQDAKNRNAIKLIASTANTTTAIKTAMEIKYDTLESAENVRNKIYAMLDDLILQTENFDNTDEFYQKLKDLKNKIALAIPPAGSSISDIQTISTELDTCGIVAVFEKYGTLGDLETDFIDRNGIRHPGLISAQTELEVLI